MKILSYILSITVFFTTIPTNSYAQFGAGAGEDPFYECKVLGENDTESQQQRIATLQGQIDTKNKEIKAKEEEYARLKAELDEASKRVQATNKDARDSSVMDAKEEAIGRLRVAESELKNLRTILSVYTEDMKNAQSTMLAIQERDQLANSSIQIFNLTSGELEKNTVAGSVADTALQLMALATSAVNHINCRASSDTDSAAYHIFQGAASVYLTNHIGATMDYEKLAECITKKAFSAGEKKDVQYALIKRARDLFNEMSNHVTEVTEKTGNDLELFNKALEYAMKEWSGKNARVETKYAEYLTAKQNKEDAYNWWLGVMIAAIVMTSMIWIPFYGWTVALPASIALWAFWGAELMPKKLRTEREFKTAKTELRKAHQHTALNCNYGDAKRWDLAKELRDFDTFLAAKKKAEKAKKAEEEARILLYKKLEQEQEKEREKSESKPTVLNFKPNYRFNQKSLIDFFIDSVLAQEEDVLQKTLTKIQDAYVKSTATEPMKGSIATLGDSSSRIPQFTPGTPQGAQVVENLRKQYEAKKQAYDAQKLVVDKMYTRLEAYMADYNDTSTRLGDVAAENPKITCSNEWPIPYYRAQSSQRGENWDTTPAGRNWNELWRTKGCTTDNKNLLQSKQKTMSDYYDTITPQEDIMNALELNMDQAELDYLTAQQINEGADSSDPRADRLNPQSVQAAAYANFLGKIKAEWKTSAMNTEKDNFILVDRTTNWTLEKLINEHPTIKALAPNKKAGFADAYTRYIYMQYAVDLVLKNLEQLARAKSLALGQAMAYQELLSQADEKLNLDAIALPTVSMAVKKQPCMKTQGGKSSPDPNCSCKKKGTCATFSFPKPVLSGSSKDLSSGVIEDYANDTFSGAEGARIKGDAVRRNAAATKTSIEETKSQIMQQRKSMGFQNTDIENTSGLLSSSISGDARRSAAAAISSKTSVGRGARILALENKTQPEKVAAAMASVQAPLKPRGVVTPKKKETLEMGVLSIDEGGTSTEGEMDSGQLDFEIATGGKAGPKAETDKGTAERPPGVEYDPTKTLWKIITKRYQKSAFPKLLKKKKTQE